MMKKISVTLVVFLISSHAFSKSQIVSEFELSLPRQFQQNLINQSWESLMNREFAANWQFPDQLIETEEVPVALKKISLKLATHLEKPSVGNSQNGFELISKNLQAELTLGEVSVDQVVSRTVGGVLGRFRVQARCENVVLKLTPGQGIFSVLGAPVVSQGAAGFSVQNVDLNWNAGAWTYDEPHCEGVEGFAAILKTEIEKINLDSQTFMSSKRELMREFLQAYLEKNKLDFSGSRQLVTGRPDLRVEMKVEEYRNLADGGAQAKGLIVIDFLKAPDQESQFLKLGEPVAVTNNFAQLRLPESFIRNFLMQFYAANSWNHRITSEKLPGFASLMQSRFAQFFVWPELLRFPKSTRFYFDLSSKVNPVIRGEALLYSVDTSLDAKMWAPRNGSYVPFMNFKIPFKTDVQVSVNKGDLQASFSDSSLNISSSWDSSYVQNFEPYKRFSSGTIRDRILSGIVGKTLNVPLPKIPVTESVSLKVQKVLTPKGSGMVLLLAP